ncbi:metal-dependent hydrolase [Methylobacter svalbardensis]|uniref:metal-dependent hydrolase n=1 Tax=Methylobacter svalbardensis TaxID=3080016 RepID=UPI0030EE33A7
MANFNTHLFVASAASIGAALIVANVHLITNADIPWLVFLGTLGGLLPDIDANNSRPVKLLFNVLSLMGVAAALHTLKSGYAPYLLVLIAAGTYLFIRYGLFALFNGLTVHRGVFHSVLAALFFGLLMTCISYRLLHWDVLHAWLNGIFIALGFIVHLLLDELYSTNLSNLRMKKSFGTALKLFSYNSMTASALMTVCTIMLYSIAPSPVPLVKVWKGTQWNNYLAQLMSTASSTAY